MATVALLKPREQAKRLEVFRIGRNCPRRAFECKFVGTESFVAQAENVERVRILADMFQEFFQVTDRGAVVLEPECVRRPTFQPRGA